MVAADFEQEQSVGLGVRWYVWVCVGMCGCALVCVGVRWYVFDVNCQMPDFQTTVC